MGITIIALKTTFLAVKVVIIIIIKFLAHNIAGPKHALTFVLMQGYKQKRAFIVAEGPMQSTVRNFWKMIYEHNCAVVVMTSSLIEGGQEASAQYWPDSGIAHYGEFAVDLLGEEKLQGFKIRNLSVLNTKVCPQLRGILALNFYPN